MDERCRLLMLSVVCSALSLSGCKSPFQFTNFSDDEVIFQWLDEQEGHWSEGTPISPKVPVVIGHHRNYFENLVGLRLNDGGRWFEASPDAMRRFHDVCGRNPCSFSYLGAGRIRARRGWNGDGS